MQLLVERRVKYSELYFWCFCSEENIDCDIREQFNPDLYIELDILMPLDSGIIEVSDHFYEELFSASVSVDRFGDEPLRSPVDDED